MKTEKMRLAKKIAESGVASRREAERLIEAGKVSVNSEVVRTPVFFVSDQEEISVDGKNISRNSEEISIWKFHKPREVITSKYDPQNRKTVFDFFPDIAGRLLYVGRLDYNSEGLLLFTNNGNLARKLELPSTGLKRTYRVRFFGNFPTNAVQKLKNGLTIDDMKFGSIDMEIDSYCGNKSGSANFWATMILSEGKNREIRKIMEHFGCQVNRLIRISYGSLELGNLPPGKFAKIPKAEVLKLLKLVKFF